MNKITSPETVKYSIILNSRNNKKRIEEANEKLKELYPYNLEASKIKICKTDKKGLFDVYISDSWNEDMTKPYGYFFVFIIALIILLLTFFGIRKITVQRRNTNQLQKQYEQEAEDQEKQNRYKKESLKKLSLEYEALRLNEYGKMFPRLQDIYSVIKIDSIIENISIDKNSFSIEITTKDALSVLNAFELNPCFSNVKMNKTTVEDSKEVVTYTGIFSHTIKSPDENLTIDEKIQFYEKEIKNIENKNMKQQDKQLSDYISGIRDVLHSSGCTEQYIQVRNVEDSSEVEFFIQSNSKSILSFLEKIQEENEFIYNIKRLIIRNGNNSKIQASLCFDSKIMNGKEEFTVQQNENNKISAEELDKIFRKPVKKNVEKKVSISKSASFEKNPKEPKINKSLSFLGISKIKDKTMISVKDEIMGVIYNIRLVDQEPADSSDYCLETSNGFVVRLRGEYYEVKV